MELLLSMLDLAELLKKNNYPFLIKDGGMASELEKRGYNLNTPLWSAELIRKDPEVIYKIHYDYLKSGADIILTSTYQATLPGLMNAGFSLKEGESLIREGASLARQARRDFLKNNPEFVRPILIGGSAGPFGAYLANGSEYSGNYSLTEEEYIRFHLPRASLLMESGVDFVAFETIPNIAEAKAILKMLENWPDKSAWLTFSGKTPGQISSYEKFEDAVVQFSSSPKLFALGINCTSPDIALSLMDIARNNSINDLVVYPNSGEIFDSIQKRWEGSGSRVNWKYFIDRCMKKKIGIIGGCCRTGPADIAEIYSLRNDFIPGL